MSNLVVLLKQEITRLSRREVRRQIEGTKKASAQHRRGIALLKRQVGALERQLALLQGRVARAPGAAARAPAAPPGKLRFVAKGVKAHRDRLGLSAADYGKLAGVSAQSVYNWEHGHASPRGEQLRLIATLRSIGKREAHARLTQLGAKSVRKPRGKRKRG